jgi:DNA-binding NarL/FixJ family response regulator
VPRQRRVSTRIGIVDDHPVFRLGLTRALERDPDFEIGWETGSAANLDAMMRKSPVDVILIDLFLGPGDDGLAAIRAVIERWPDVMVAAMSAGLDARLGPASLRAGAGVFLLKVMPVSEMVSSIKRLAASSATRSRGRARSAGRSRATGGRVGGLSPRQRQVLEYLRLGRTNKEIAARLGVSIGTVNKHVHQVFMVLKVHNRTQAAAVAAKEAID